MSNKRPPIDLMALTSLTAERATPMPEAVQRVTETAAKMPKLPKSLTDHAKVPTEELVSLSFKVPPLFRKRFRNAAHMADLQKVELLHEALDAWEEKHGKKFGLKG